MSWWENRMGGSSLVIDDNITILTMFWWKYDDMTIYEDVSTLYWWQKREPKKHWPDPPAKRLWAWRPHDRGIQLFRPEVLQCSWRQIFQSSWHRTNCRPQFCQKIFHNRHLQPLKIDLKSPCPGPTPRSQWWEGTSWYPPWQWREISWTWNQRQIYSKAMRIVFIFE